MDDFHRINGPRVDKIMGMLDVIAKSARSNKAEDAMAELLEPVRVQLGAHAPAAVPVAEPAERSALYRGNPNGRQPMWSCVREMAETAPLKDLSVAVAIYTTRVDDALHEMK